MKAVIISVGTELLIGSTLNTHGQYLSHSLNAVGIGVVMHMSVGDNVERIHSALELAEKMGDLIILTGGLGPTQDDLTRYALGAYLRIPIEQDEGTKNQLEGFFTRIGRPMTENNLRQADFPMGSVLLENHYGTAKGFILKHQNHTYAALPGPPKELTMMVENELLARLVQGRGTIHSTFLKVYGIGESALEDRIKTFIAEQGEVTIAPYVGSDDVALRLTVLKETTKDAENAFKPLIKALKDHLGIFLFSESNEDLATALLKNLKFKKMTLSTAESCTGGLIGSKLTRVSGASQSYIQGLITYSNQSKVQYLGVTQETLDTFGAVSAETAHEMLTGLQNASQADCGIVITGIAGPDGGTEEKPVGTVFIGIYINEQRWVKQYRLWGTRDRIQQRASNHALFILYNLLQSNENELEML